MFVQDLSEMSTPNTVLEFSLISYANQINFSCYVTTDSTYVQHRRLNNLYYVTVKQLADAADAAHGARQLVVNNTIANNVHLHTCKICN
jgi:hypothetical protein